MKIYNLVIRCTLTVAALAATSVHAVPFEDNYYVRPGLRVGGGAFQDGYIQNGTTSASQTQSVIGTSRSTVDLGDGTVKMFAAESFASEVGLQTFGGFGERLRIQNGQGTDWSLSFAIEGTISGVVGFAAEGPLPPTFVYDVGLVVLEAGIGTGLDFLDFARDLCFGQDPDNCIPTPAPLADRYSRTTYEPSFEGFNDDFSIDVSESVTANIRLDSNDEFFDVFVYTNVFLAADTAGADSGLQGYVLDFENTATYEQSFADGVEVFSSSGEFLGLADFNDDLPPNPVPSPSVLHLLLVGLMCFPLARRRLLG